MKYGYLLGLWSFLSAVAHGDIVPDGSTNTSVSTDSLNRTVVDIAQADADRISHNRYSAFSTGSEGTLINNRTAGARTIIHEVTGNMPSQLSGEIRVLGTSAHMIVANPNGITVDGAEFFNTGALALTTGTIGFNEQTDSFGRTFRNPTADVDGGTIRIAPGGLSGVMNQLELIAETIKVEGKVENQNESAFAGIELHAGKSTTEFQSGLSVSDIGGAWANVTPEDNSQSDAIAIEITRGASLVSSRLLLMVTDAGAGVRHDGDLLASANTFSLSADGHIEMGGNIRSAGELSIDARSVQSATLSDEQNRIESQFANVDIDLQNHSSFTGTLISGAGAEEGTSVVDIRSDNDILLNTLDENRRTVVFSGGDINIEAQSLINYSSRVLGNAGIELNVDKLINDVLIDDFDNRGEVVLDHDDGKRLWYSAFLTREKISSRSINFGEPEAGRIKGEYISSQGDIVIKAPEIFSRGTDVITNDGSISVEAETFDNQAQIVGRASLSRRCNLGGCDERGSSSVDLLGGKWQASNTLNVTASSRFSNSGGTLQAVQDLTIDSPIKTTSGLTVYDVLTRNSGLRGLFLKNEALWVQVDQGGDLVSNMGKLILSGGALQVDGGRVTANEIEGDVDIVREPTTQELLLIERVGLLKGVF